MQIQDARVLRSLKLTEQQGEKRSTQYTATEDYLLIFDTRNPSFQMALDDDTTWPNLGDKKLPQLDDQVVISGVTLYCNSRELSAYQDNDRSLVMSVRYASREDGDEGEPGNDPEAWQRVEVQTVSVTKPARGWRSLGNSKDAPVSSQSPAVNSASDPVDGLEEESSMLRLTYTNANAANPHFPALHSYVNKCNFGVFSILGIGCTAYTVRCVGFNASYDQKNNTWSVTVEMLYNPDGWEIRFYDAGFNEVRDGKRIAILDDRGNPISSPVPLNGQGEAISPPRVSSESSEAAADGLFMRTLYPYISTDLNNIWTDCRI